MTGHSHSCDLGGWQVLVDNCLAEVSQPPLSGFSFHRFRLYDETEEQLQARWQAAHAADGITRETSVFAQRSEKDSVGPTWYARE